MTDRFKTGVHIVGLVMVLAIGSSVAMAAGQHKGGHGDEEDKRHMQKEGHGQGGGHGQGQGHAFEFGKPGKAADVTRTIDIVMKDNLYEPETISIKAGETVRFRIRNQGEALHEFGLGTEAMHEAHRPHMAMMVEHGMLEVDRINYERMKMDHGDGKGPMNHDDPNSKLVEPGKSAEIIWTFTKAMALEFACNIPGHYESGMVGDILFE